MKPERTRELVKAILADFDALSVPDNATLDPKPIITNVMRLLGGLFENIAIIAERKNDGE